MKAVVLVGGEGTRLRPLTETIPKPLLPLVDRPFLHQVLDHLGAHGVHEVVLSSPYLERTFDPFLAERSGDPRVTWITESEPRSEERREGKRVNLGGRRIVTEENMFCAQKCP